MVSKRLILGFCVLILGGVLTTAAANERSFDYTARLLSTPLAEPVPTPEVNRFRFGLIGGRWHLRDNDYSLNMTVAGASLGYTRFFDENWGINLHLDAERLKGQNSPFEASGYGGEFGIDLVRGLKTKPSSFGPLNGSSAFLGLLAWESRLDGDLHDLVFGPTGRQDLKVTLRTYMFRAGWQGKFWLAKAATLEPSGYLYFQNHFRRVEIDTLGVDDDAKPTSFGVALNLNAGFYDLITPGDGFVAGVAGAMTFDHNISWQFQLAYTFGALNAAGDEN